MNIAGKRVDGLDLVLAVVGVILVMGGIAMLIGAVTTGLGEGGIILLVIGIALVFGGIGALAPGLSHASRKGAGPQIEG